MSLYEGSRRIRRIGEWFVVISCATLVFWAILSWIVEGLSYGFHFLDLRSLALLQALPVSLFGAVIGIVLLGTGWIVAGFAEPRS